MKEKNRFPGGGHIGILALVVALLFSSNYVVAGQQTAPPKEANFKIFSLKHISVEQGEDYLAKFVTGTITHFPGSSTLLVTAQPGELAKAQILLNLLDEPGQFVTKTLLPVSAARSIPSNEQIAARLSPSLTRGVSIGSFSHPPSPDAKIKAIIDIHNDAVVAIAPPSLMDQIVSVLGRQFQDSRPSVRRITQTLPPIPPARKGPGIIEPDDTRLFLSADSSVETDPNAIAQAVEDESAEGSPANRSYQLPPLVNGEQIVDLALGERQKLTIAELLGLVGPYLQLDFLYTEEEVDQKITISPNGKWAGPVKIKDLYPMLETVLKYKNLVMTRSGSNLVTIAPKANALDIDPTLVEDGTRQIKRGDGILQRIFKLNHIETSVAKKLLEEMKLYTSITEVPETKTLIVTAYAYRMPRIQALLDIVDRPGKPRRFRFRPLQYTMAEALAPKLQTLAEQLGTISITIAADESTPKATPRPVKRPTESTTAYNARLRQWSAAQAQRARSAAAARRSTSSTQQTEPSEPSVYVEADERTNRILMVGFDEQLDDVEKLIETLDVAQQDLRSLESYNIEHVDAEEVKAKLEELGIISPSLTSPYYNSRLTGDSKSPTASSPTAARTRSPAAIAKMQQSETAQTPLDEPQVVVIEQTNSLLVNATAEQHAKIHKIVEYVDSEPKEGDIPVKIYPLENQSPDHLAEVIKPLIEETIMDKEGKAVQEVKKKQPEDQIEIVPDPNTFSLVVYASKKNQIWIGDLIEKLDQRRPQVLIDVTLVQISKEDKFDYDLNIISSFPDLTQTSGLTSAIMAGVEGAANNNLVSNLTNSSRDRFIDLQSNGGYGTGFYGDKHINLLLTAMQEKNYGRVLAKPKILVNDNEEGTISTTDTTYVTKTSSIPVSSGGAGQNATLIETGVSYEPYEAGIELTIVPHISRGGFLRLDITLQRDDFDYGSTMAGERPPNTNGSNINTTVTVPDGSTIILGGLIKLNQSKGGAKIPILGDIPLLGGLFRSTNNTDTQRNLYVFVKAEIIQPPEKGIAQMDNLRDISERNRSAFEDHEKEFQDYEDWPGIKPKPMAPANVLDAQ